MLFLLDTIPEIKNMGLVNTSDTKFKNESSITTVPSINHLVTIDNTEILIEIYGKEALGIIIAECPKLTPKIEKFLGEKRQIASRDDVLGAI